MSEGTKAQVGMPIGSHAKTIIEEMTIIILKVCWGLWIGFCERWSDGVTLEEIEIGVWGKKAVVP